MAADLITAGGIRIEILPGGDHCIVYIDGRPEEIGTVPSERFVKQLIPRVLFVGVNFQISLSAGQHVLVPLQGGRLRIPYRQAGQLRHLGLGCASRADQFPVVIGAFSDARQLLASPEASSFRFFIVDESVSRLDLVSIKARHTTARLIILRPEESEGPQARRRPATEWNPDRMRATDLLAAGAASEQQNPVFHARLFLRQMQLDKVRDLIADDHMGADEILFVRTFLGNMIKNASARPELAKAGDALRELDRLYALASDLLGGERARVQAQIEAGVGDTVRVGLLGLIKRLERSPADRVEEIELWEWGYRLRRQTRPPDPVAQ